MLSLTLELEPLQIAFRGLHVEDPLLKGTALEYLAASLPSPVAEKLLPLLEAVPPPPADPGAARDKLLCSAAAIELNLTARLARQPTGGGKSGG